jgi:hypothetical protein
LYHHLTFEKTFPFLGAAVLDQSDFFEVRPLTGELNTLQRNQIGQEQLHPKTGRFSQKSGGDTIMLINKYHMTC